MYQNLGKASGFIFSSWDTLPLLQWFSPGRTIESPGRFKWEKQIQCPDPKHAHLVGRGWSMGIGMFKGSPGDTNVQQNYT